MELKPHSKNNRSDGILEVGQITQPPKGFLHPKFIHVLGEDFLETVIKYL